MDYCIVKNMSKHIGFVVMVTIVIDIVSSMSVLINKTDTLTYYYYSRVDVRILKSKLMKYTNNHE